MADYQDPDAFYDARFAEGVAESRRQLAVVLGAQNPAGHVGEKSIGDQVLAANVDGTNAVKQVLQDTSSRAAVTQTVAMRTEERVARIEAKLDDLINLLSGDSK